MSHPRVNILLVEDNPGDVRLIQEMLRETEYADADLQVASTLQDALQYPLKAGTVTTILLDLNLPDSQGLATLRKIQKPFASNVIVVLTGLADERLALKALGQGAQSYLTKDTIGPGELAKTIRYSIERHGFILRIRESDQEMLARERRFRSLIDRGSDLILLVDRDAKVTYASPSVHRLYGFTPFGMNAFNAVSPHDAPIVRRHFAEALEQPEVAIPLVMRTRTMEGNMFTMEGSITNLLHVEGVHAVVVNLHDVSERVAALESVAFERNNQRALIDSSTDMIWSVDRDFKVITANKACRNRIQAVGDLEVESGKTIVPNISFGAYDNEKWKTYYERALSGESFTIEEHVMEPEAIWGEFNFSPIREGNHVVGVACAGRDVTHRKRAENDVRRLNTDLEQRVLDRTQELTSMNSELNMQVQQNRKLSELLIQRNADLMDSITYARRIQEGISHATQNIGFFSASASFALPRDVVSGDFLWHHETAEHMFVVIGDCTGHGVPGALMSMLAHSLLDQLIVDRRNTRPEMILGRLDQSLDRLFTKHEPRTRPNDGMDMGCLVIDKSTMQLSYSGALIKAIIIRDHEQHALLANRYPIGGLVRSELKKFTAHRFQLRAGDRIAVSTDGYYSQFGGKHGKKMKTAPFLSLLLACVHLSAAETAVHLESSFRSWMGAEPQVDDVLVAILDV